MIIKQLSVRGEWYINEVTVMEWCVQKETTSYLDLSLTTSPEASLTSSDFPTGITCNPSLQPKKPSLVSKPVAPRGFWLTPP